jgi:putative hydrolase of the HAD superfamily
MFEYLAFDADDTLWHSEKLYAEIQERFTKMLSNYHDSAWINDKLYETESSNMKHFGYGVKAFSLSLIETAIELTEGRISSKEIKEIVGWSKEMLTSEIELLPNVNQIISQLSAQYPLMIITKGDLLDQETKIKKSGLANYFRHIEIVSNKTSIVYEALLKKYRITPNRFIMIGNSLPSDILPILKLGSNAIHIPYEITWLHEIAEPPPKDHTGFYQLKNIGELPLLLEQITQ